MYKMRYNIKKYIIIVVSILIVWLGGVPLFLSAFIPILFENLSHNSEYVIKIEKPVVYTNILPFIRIKTDSVYISSKETKDNISIQGLNIKVRLLPLLSGRFHINDIYMKSVLADSILNNNSVLDKNFSKKIKNANVKCDKLKIDTFTVNLREPNLKIGVNYFGKNLNFIKKDRFIKFDIDSSLVADNKTSIIKVNLFLPKSNNIDKTVMDVQLSNIDIQPICRYFKNYLPSDISDIKGLIDFDADNKHFYSNIRNFSIINKDSFNSIIFPDSLNIKAGYNLTRKVLSISEAEITSKNINLGINGKISNFLDKTRTQININLRLNPSKVEDITNMLPSFKTEDIDIYKLKKYKFFGDIIGNLSIKGDSLEPSINGDIFINNGILTKPIPNAKGAVVKLSFKGKYLNFDVSVPAGENEKVSVYGGVELYNVKYSDMKVKSTNNVDLSIAEEKVNPLHEILNFVVGPVPIMNIKGIGNIDIAIKGNRKRPHIWGTMNVRNVTTFFNDMPDLILNDADAVLKFDDEIVTFNLQKGLINKNNINIDGNCNLNGKFDFNVQAQKQELAYLHKAISTSNMIKELKNMIPQFEQLNGLADLKLKIYGNVKDINDLKFNENFFIKGELALLNNIVQMQGIKIEKVIGNITFENNSAILALTSYIGNSQLKIAGSVKENFVDTVLIIPKLNLSRLPILFNDIPKDMLNIIVDVSAKYKGNIDKIDTNKLELLAKVLNVSSDNKLQLRNGIISLKNGNLQIKNLNGIFTDTKSEFSINLDSENIASKPDFNGQISLKNFDLRLLNMMKDFSFIPQNISKYTKCINFEQGKINLNAKINSNVVNASTNIGGIAFNYSPDIANLLPKTDNNNILATIPVKIVNGSLYIHRNSLGLNKINMIADNMPVLVDGTVNNIFSKQDFNLYINSKPNQEFIDKYINNNRIYPIKFKGDIVYWTKIKGTKDDYRIQSEANLEKNSNVYYLGATIGDIENAITVKIDMDVIKQRLLRIKEFSYDKLIESQGKRTTSLNLLKASGDIDILKNDLGFHDLKIKTSNPTDAKIFNILFRKPNIKQGQFTSNLKFNGTLSKPKLTGNFHIVETNIPFFDTTMKNLSFVFKDKTIDLYSTGEILGNDINFTGILRNKLTVPYYIEQAEVNTKFLDLNYITERIKTVQIDENNAFDTFNNFDLKNTVIKNMNIKADKIRLRNLTAEQVDANLSISDKKVFNINDFKFKIADGFINGKFSYNLIDNNLGLNLNAENINANDLSIALFNLNNHIYGDLTGELNLSCKGSDFNNCMKTLNGKTSFNVTDGRMPKLGSLEYLLKAGNLVKSGVTGISINGIIDILTPLKTGSFSTIYGRMNIKDGISDDIEIATKGKDLSLYMFGSYNFASSQADMEVLGLLSKKISTLLGPIGNVSMNTLFNVVPGVDLSKDSIILEKINKIPGIELSGKAFRKFIAEIKGDISSDNYVNSFRWIN